MEKRGAKIILVLLIVIVLFISMYISLYLIIGMGISGNIIGLSESQKEEKIVTKIIDGDTVIVEGGESVRLLGIDCDEKGKECFTPAKKRIDELLLGKTVELEMEKEDRDMYDRQLRWIFLNGNNINLQLVEEGYCVARFVGESKYKEEIQKAEKNAIINGIGCKWS
ncbi:MAG: thermonuclease family protein [Candidatus Pacearchaeota archaeon]|jgi:endonuclease YncB( thermonuclease family)